MSKIYELLGPGDLRIKEEELDFNKLGPDQVGAETLYSAISPGTEMAAYNGTPGLRDIKIYPRVLGYCNVAKVIATGSRVSNYEEGDIILSFQSHRSAFISDADKIVLKLPENQDLAKLATTYLYHLGYNALLKSDLKPGHNIAIVGLGTLGITTASLACLFGGNVLGFTNQNYSPELAEDIGFAGVFPKNAENLKETIDSLTHTTGIDTVISTSNLWEDWKLGMEIARKGGKICVLGFPGREQPIPDFNPMDSRYFYEKQLEYVATGAYSDVEIDPFDIRFTVKRNCQYLVDLMGKNKINPEVIIDSVEPWDKLGELYEKLKGRTANYTYVLKWD